MIQTLRKKKIERKQNFETHTLTQIQNGQFFKDWPREVINSKKRENCAPLAPAKGLYLEKVKY